MNGPHAANSATALLARRQFLADAGSGLGAIALAWMLNADGYGAEPAAGEKPGPGPRVFGGQPVPARALTPPGPHPRPAGRWAG